MERRLALRPRWNARGAVARGAARLPHLTPHDVAEIDAEVRAVLSEIGNS
jgi:hypothetical protein